MSATVAPGHGQQASPLGSRTRGSATRRRPRPGRAPAGPGPSTAAARPRCPSGATPPIANPVASRTNCGSAGPSFTADRLARPALVDPVGARGHHDTACAPARNTIDLAICATAQPIAAAASAAVRVPSGKARMVSGCPAANKACRTRSTERCCRTCLYLPGWSHSPSISTGRSVWPSARIATSTRHVRETHPAGALRRGAAYGVGAGRRPGSGGGRLPRSSSAAARPA